MEKYWKDLGPVTRVWNGNVVTFSNLKEAVFGLRESQINDLKYGHARVYDHIRDRDYCLVRGDEFVFFDDCGLSIPVWKVKETYFNISRAERRAYLKQACAPWVCRYWGFHDFKFRDGPVPGLRRGRRFNHNRSANVQTTQEIRENDFIDYYDEDAREHNIKARRARARKNLPTAWDDRPRGSYDQTNWKHFRKHQWVGK